MSCTCKLRLYSSKFGILLKILSVTKCISDFLSRPLVERRGISPLVTPHRRFLRFLELVSLVAPDGTGGTYVRVRVRVRIRVRVTGGTYRE